VVRGLRDREIYPDVGWQSPSGGSRPVPIGSLSIGVSLQPAIPRRVAPQQSPSPLHRSPILITHLRFRRSIRCAARPSTARTQTSLRSHWPMTNIGSMPMQSAPHGPGCHFYFARQVTFLSCADNAASTRGTEHATSRKQEAGNMQGTTITPDFSAMVASDKDRTGLRSSSTMKSV